MELASVSNKSHHGTLTSIKTIPQALLQESRLHHRENPCQPRREHKTRWLNSSKRRETNVSSTSPQTGNTKSILTLYKSKVPAWNVDTYPVPYQPAQRWKTSPRTQGLRRIHMVRTAFPIAENRRRCDADPEQSIPATTNLDMLNETSSRNNQGQTRGLLQGAPIVQARQGTARQMDNPTRSSYSSMIPTKGGNRKPNTVPPHGSSHYVQDPIATDDHRYSMVNNSYSP